jgi:hypothetical protein
MKEKTLEIEPRRRERPREEGRPLRWTMDEKAIPARFHLLSKEIGPKGPTLD